MVGPAGHLPSSGRVLAISGRLTGTLLRRRTRHRALDRLGRGDLRRPLHLLGRRRGAGRDCRDAARAAPVDLAQSFGWYRAEVIGALTNGAFLIVMALVVIVMGAMRLRHPMELPTGLLAAAGGLETEFVSLYLLYRQQGQGAERARRLLAHHDPQARRPMDRMRQRSSMTSFQAEQQWAAMS